MRTTIWLATFSAGRLVGVAQVAQPTSSVALATNDPLLREAVLVALEPWGVRVQSVGDPSLGASMPGSADRGRAIASAHGAQAVVWVAQSEEGWSLWMYDAESDRVVARRLTTPPPFDEPTAAAVALSIKTLLRHGSVAPPAERVVAPEEIGELSLGLAVGARLFGTDPGAAEPRVGAIVLVSPHPLGGFGFGASMRAGLGAELSTPAVAARWNDVRLAAVIAFRGSVAPKLELGLGVELGIAIGWLEGRVTGLDRSFGDVRADASGAVWADLGWAPTNVVRIALRIGIDLAARDRTYLVRGQPVIALSPVAPLAEAGIEVRP